MSMGKAMLTGAIQGSRPVLVAFYAAWATKLILIDSEVNPLLAAAAVSLSVYGLWVLVRKSTDYFIAKMSHDDEHQPS
jgi:hypothetical protein